MNPKNAPLQVKWTVGWIVGLVTLLPWVLTRLGMGFGSASQGGAGAHFAGITINDFIFRFDVNALAVVAVILAMTVAYNRVSQSRFIMMLGLTLVASGFNDAIHIVPMLTRDGSFADYNTVAVWSTTLSRTCSALILLVGIFSLRYGHHYSPRKTVYQVLIPSLCFFALARATMLGLGEGQAVSAQALNLFTLGCYLFSALMLKGLLRSFKMRFFAHGVMVMLVPLSAGVIWLLASVDTIQDQGFHIAVLLKWFAWMVPTAGLCIDYVNTFYAKGLSSEKRFLRAVIDSIPHFIFARDLEGNFTLVNKAVADFYGLKVREVEGRHLFDVHGNNAQSLEWIVEDKATIDQGLQWTMPETVTTDANGKDIWIHAIKRPFKIGPHQEDQILGVTIDITQQKEAEIALSKRLEMERIAARILKSFVHCTNDNFHPRMASILDRICHYTNASRGSIYRLDKDSGSAALLFNSIQKTNGSGSGLPPLLDADAVSWMIKSFALHEPVAVDCAEELPADSATFHAAWCNPESTAFLTIPIFSKSEIFGFMGIESDQRQGWTLEEIQFLRNTCSLFITVFSKLESERSLVSAMKEAQASSRAKTEFLANMSHEIRTPMNCVIGISELLRGMDPAPAQQQYLDMIHQSGNALLDLINDILDLSKIEAGQLELDPVPTDLHAVIDEVARLIAFAAQAKDLEVICRIAPDVPRHTVLDSGRLRQVLTNLLNNATKFTQKGHLYINVEPVGEAEGKVALRFQIADTGIGISESQLAKIFEKFTQADASTTRRFGGTGLGLSISQHLINLMGGRITATSEVNLGSIFEFTLPVPRDTESGKLSPLVSPENRAKLLVITESDLSGKVLAEQVTSLGHKSTVVRDCAKAIKLFAGHADQAPWDYILLDQSAAEQTVQLLSETANVGPGQKPPKFILMTGLSSMLTEAELKNQGFAGSLAKPVRLENLVNLFQNGPQEQRDTKQTLAQDPAHPMENAAADPSGPRILLAEDNIFNQKVAIGMLNFFGCSVEVANNGVEALERLQNEDFDLVFMDCQMPEMDGYEATRNIRSLSGDVSSIPIIAMTANALSGDRNKCMVAGMDDFLSKPITKAKLNSMLQKWKLIGVS